jgi:phage gp45-like
MIRGIIASVVEGVIKRFTASGRSDETITNREYFQHYGLTSRPRPGAEVIIITEGGQIVAIASDDRRYRIGLEEGEVALYDDLGQKVHLSREGMVVSSPVKITATAPEVEIVAAARVVMTTPSLEVSGNITAGGQIADGTRSMAADRSI